jgi:hypothetical protein
MSSGSFERRSVRAAAGIVKGMRFFAAVPWLTRLRSAMTCRAAQEPNSDGVWSLYYGTFLLARFDEREKRFYG